MHEKSGKYDITILKKLSELHENIDKQLNEIKKIHEQNGTITKVTEVIKKRNFEAEEYKNETEKKSIEFQ